jgi:NitT/TauT family transport system substrate-binding protein
MTDDTIDCCGETTAAPRPVAPRRASFTRRDLMRRTGILAGGLGLAACGLRGRGDDDLERVQLAFCSQLLCVVPYEVTREEGHFAEQGLDVELVYSRGGGAALQALQGGAVDYAATSFDAAAQAFAGGADIRRFASTGRLPLFALATAPETAGEITEVGDLAGRTVAVSALGNADHSILLFLLDQAGVDSDDVEFATIGTNLYDVLRIGDVDAGMVQEPALSLLEEDGARVLFNAMDLDDAERFLGGPYEFMGVAVRSGEIEERREQMTRLADALVAGLEATRTLPVERLIAALPAELIAGEDTERLAATLDRYRESLYPAEVGIDVDATERALESLRISGAVETDIDLDALLDLDVVGEA